MMVGDSSFVATGLLSTAGTAAGITGIGAGTPRRDQSFGAKVRSQEQSGGIAGVTTAIRQMDEMTQHNAALVEETNAAIEQTGAQATALDRVVDVFIVETSPAGAAEARSALSRRAA